MVAVNEGTYLSVEYPVGDSPEWVWVRRRLLTNGVEKNSIVLGREDLRMVINELRRLLARGQK